MQDLAAAQPGEAIRMARTAAGLSQQVLATRAGVAQRTLARIEQGEDARLSTLDRIAAVLGLTTADLLAPEPTEQVS